MKKLVLAVVVVFLGFWLFTDPDGLANATTSSADAIWGGAQALFSSVIEFIGEL
jgi:hypothetical protein